jgi:outer membrane cobalamin receptor
MKMVMMPACGDRNGARRAACLGLLLCCALPLLDGAGYILHAQTGGSDSLRADTLKIYHGEEVVVAAESILPGLSRGTQPLSVMSRQQVEAANAVDVSDAVAFAPGVFVKQYGGLGGLRTVSLRGTSAQQTVLLIDGVRYQSSATGLFDLSNLPADAVERIEVMRGGNATLYGANTLGGAINLVGSPPGAGELRVMARLALGSFGERRLGVSADGSAGGHTWDATLSSTVAGGDYPFLFNEYGELRSMRRDNADFSNLFARAAWSYHGDEGLAVSWSAQGFRSERGTPGAVVQGNREQLRARLDERDLFSVARVAISAGQWGLSAAVSGRLNSLRYLDPDARLAGPSGIDNHYSGGEASLALRGRRMVGRNGVIDLAAESSYATLRGDNLDPDAGSFIRRVQWSAAATSNWFFEEGLFGWETGIDGGLRADLFSDIAGALSPSLGINIRLGSTPLRLRTRAGLNYRAPSFSEQYYLNYGNRDLRPERSTSIDAGFTCELGDLAVLESGLFLIDTRDQIVAVPRSPVSWSAANVARVRSRGIELGAVGSLFDGLIDARASYTLMRAEDRSGGVTDGRLLVYSPQEIFTGLVELRLGPFSLGLNWQYVSHRHTLPMNDAGSALPHYAIAGAGASARWRLGPADLTARLECSNIFDAEYQVVRNYPMPGRTVRAELVIRFTEREGS